jgi:hypothetical protein
LLPKVACLKNIVTEWHFMTRGASLSHNVIVKEKPNGLESRGAIRHEAIHATGRRHATGIPEKRATRGLQHKRLSSWFTGRQLNSPA